MPYRPAASPFLAASTADLAAYLRRRGYGPILDALADPSCYTRSGKVNCSAIGRLIGVSSTQAMKVYREMVADAKAEAEAG